MNKISSDIKHTTKGVLGHIYRGIYPIKNSFFYGNFSKFKRYPAAIDENTREKIFFFTLLQRDFFKPKEKIEIEKFRTRFCEYHKIEKQKLDDFSKELNFKLITVDNEYWCAQSMFTLSGCYSITSKKGKEPSKVFVDEVEKEEEVIKSKLDAISKFAKEHKMKFYVPNNDIYFTLFCEHTLETEVERTDSNDPTKSEITKETTTSKE